MLYKGVQESKGLPILVSMLLGAILRRLVIFAGLYLALVYGCGDDHVPGHGEMT